MTHPTDPAPVLTAGEWAEYVGRDHEERVLYDNVVASSEAAAARLGWSPGLMALANAALPDGHPVKIQEYADIDEVDLFVRRALHVIEDSIRDTHRGAPEWRIEEEIERVCAGR